MKKLVILLVLISFVIVNLSQNVSAVISCGSQTYPDGSGYCCDQGNGANGVWFRGDYYSQCPSTPGNYRYVSNSGNDANNGLTPATAWGTMDKVNDDLLPGQTAIILGGVWNEQGDLGPSSPNFGQYRDCGGGSGGIAATLRLDRTATASNPFIVKGHPDYPRPILKGSGFNSPFPQSVQCGSLDQNGTGHCLHRSACIGAYTTLDYLEITDSYGGIIAGGVSNVAIQDMVIHDTYGNSGNNDAGISFRYEANYNLVIRGNEIYKIYDENPDDSVWAPTLSYRGGILLYRTTNALIEDNIIHDIMTGIFLKAMDSKIIVRRNTLYDVSENIILWCAAWAGFGDDTNDRRARDNQIYENIIYSTGAIDIDTGIIFYEAGTPGECATFGHPIENSSAFNNIVYNGRGSGLHIYSFNARHENVSWFNNIVSNLGYYLNRENLVIVNPSDLPGFKSDYNILFDDPSFGDGNEVVRWVEPTESLYDLPQYQSVSRTIFPPNGLDEHSKQQDPMFLSTNPSSPDFLRPNPLTSPAIDAGIIVQGYHCNVSASIDPTQTGCKLWYGSAPDIGAYEYNPGTPIVTCAQADVNDDLIINIIDLALVIYNQGQPLTGRAHLNVNSQDSVINYQDVSEVRNRLGQAC